MRAILEALAAALKVRRVPDVKEAFIDGSFAPGLADPGRHGRARNCWAARRSPARRPRRNGIDCGDHAQPRAVSGACNAEVIRELSSASRDTQRLSAFFRSSARFTSVDGRLAHLDLALLRLNHQHDSRHAGLADVGLHSGGAFRMRRSSSGWGVSKRSGFVLLSRGESDDGCGEPAPH
jgi:hypothetical protein